MYLDGQKVFPQCQSGNLLFFVDFCCLVIVVDGIPCVLVDPFDLVLSHVRCDWPLTFLCAIIVTVVGIAVLVIALVVVTGIVVQCVVDLPMFFLFVVDYVVIVSVVGVAEFIVNLIVFIAVSLVIRSVVYGTFGENRCSSL